MLQVVNFKLVKLIAVMLLAIAVNTHQVVAQAPDCDMCDQYLEGPDPDPVEYAQCVEEFCSDDIPIDNDIWILIVGGIGMAGYAFYRYSKNTLTPSAQE